MTDSNESCAMAVGGEATNGDGVLQRKANTIRNLTLKADLKLMNKELEKEFEEVRHIRLMVVGMFGAGKTTLVRRLCKQNYNTVESTVGIDIHTYSCEIDKDGDWELSSKDEEDKLYSDRLSELVNRYGKRTQSQDFPLTSGPISMIKNTANSRSTALLKEGEIKKETVTENVFMDFRGAVKEKQIPERKPTVSIWDFAGQSVYYSTHHFFHSARSVYLLVLDLSKKLSDTVEERNPCLESTTEGYTYHDAFKFWMKSIYYYTEQKGRKTALSYTERMQNNLLYRPTIVLIGTHKDLFNVDSKEAAEYAEDYFNKALECFIGTTVLDLVHHKKFLISKDDKPEEFLCIKKEILKIAKMSSFWRERIPASFILLEKVLLDQKNQRKTLMLFENLEEANEALDLPFKEKDEIKAFLAFQTDLGNVCYYQDCLDHTIILNPQWIIDLFKIFVTHKTGKKPVQLLLWKKFMEYGQLATDLIYELLQTNDFSDMKEEIVRLLEYLNIVVKPIASEGNEAPETGCTFQERVATPFFQKYCVDMQIMEDFYIMPFMLPPRPRDENLKEFLADCGSLGQPPTLCMHIMEGFVPPPVFHCIIATVIKELPVAIVKGERLIFSGLAGFRLNSTRILVIWCIDNFLYVTVIFKDHDETQTERMECCKDVKGAFEKLVLSAFNFHGKNTFDDDLFEYRVKCPKCPQQIPFQKALKQNSYIDIVGLMSVNQLEAAKKISCSICDMIVNEEEALGYWFDIRPNKTGPASTDQEDHLNDIPTLDMLADFAEEIGRNHRDLAHELSIGDKEYQKIEKDYGMHHTSLVFHILYNWKRRNQTLERLYEAMHKANCISDDFKRIVNGLEKEATERIIKDCMERLDVNKFEKGYQWDRVVDTLVECIGAEYWIVGIRLGIEEEYMQKMSSEHGTDIKGYIREYLGVWKQRHNSLYDLIKALVKSSSNIDAIVDATEKIYSR